MDKSQYLPIEISTDGQYRHNIGLGNGVLDIPSGYESINKYNGTMAHKFNHRFFKENCYAHYVRISAFFYKLVFSVSNNNLGSWIELKLSNSKHHFIQFMKPSPHQKQQCLEIF